MEIDFVHQRANDTKLRGYKQLGIDFGVPNCCQCRAFTFHGPI